MWVLHNIGIKKGHLESNRLLGRWLVTNLCFRLRSLCRRRASRASCAPWEDVIRRRSSKRRRSSEVGRAGRGTWHCTLCHCTVTLDPQQGPYQHWRGRLVDLSERLFFYSRVITFVIMPTEYLQSGRPLDTLFFMDLLMGRNDTDKTRWFPLSFSFLPRHCDCISEKLHPILYLCNTTPAHPPI